MLASFLTVCALMCMSSILRRRQFAVVKYTVGRTSTLLLWTCQKHLKLHALATRTLTRVNRVMEYLYAHSKHSQLPQTWPNHPPARIEHHPEAVYIVIIRCSTGQHVPCRNILILKSALRRVCSASLGKHLLSDVCLSLPANA